MVNIPELTDWLIFTFSDKCKFAIGKILLVHEEVCKVGQVLEESAIHKGDLIIDAGQLCDLVDEIKKGGRDVDHFIIHDLEELTQKQSCCFYKVDGVSLLYLTLSIVCLVQ